MLLQIDITVNRHRSRDISRIKSHEHDGVIVLIFYDLANCTPLNSTPLFTFVVGTKKYDYQIRITDINPLK
uniref:Uncharacterized protein n=1 Tax=mine drainage metagenome TaxID=410659 RepID=E6QG12_9ZZZZ